MDNNEKKLTQLSSRAGCAGKLTPAMLSDILKFIDNDEKSKDKNLIVGFDKSDDAGVYKISDDIALVQTVDFFTPVANDPYVFGQIAATNALSDVYAMGGKPLTALNIACFSAKVSPEVLALILKGGADKIREAGATLAGGHTVTDDEIKYGLSVTGLINPKKVLTNSGAKVGDSLILTKPLGSGVLTTALKIEFVTEEQFTEAAKVMSTLNKVAAEKMSEFNVNACTDVTGFGLIGHSIELAEGSDVAIEYNLKSIPIMANVKDLIREYCLPSGAYANEKFFKDRVKFEVEIEEILKLAYFDPQTSGGLLISLPSDEANELVEKINSESDIKAFIIGKVVEKNSSNTIKFV